MFVYAGGFGIRCIYAILHRAPELNSVAASLAEQKNQRFRFSLSSPTTIQAASHKVRGYQYTQKTELHNVLTHRAHLLLPPVHPHLYPPPCYYRLSCHVVRPLPCHRPLLHLPRTEALFPEPHHLYQMRRGRTVLNCTHILRHRYADVYNPPSREGGCKGEGRR